MTGSYGQSETQAVRRGSEKPNLLDNSNRKESIEAVGGRVQVDFAESTARENCSAGDTAKTLLGGILDQLIEDAQIQLGKTRECIVWYQNEQKEIEAKIRHLQELKALEKTPDDPHT